jgi:hypothetical protein
MRLAALVTRFAGPAVASLNRSFCYSGTRQCRLPSAVGIKQDPMQAPNDTVNSRWRLPKMRSKAPRSLRTSANSTSQ